MKRRHFLASSIAVPFLFHGIAQANDNGAAALANERLASLEQELDGRLGLCAIDTGTGARLGYRDTERFPLNSTFKVMLAGAILKRSEEIEGLLQRRVHYGQRDLVSYSPITEKHVAHGLTVTELCAAALQYSDNSASNLLMKQLGGPSAVSAFARDVKDPAFRLDRWETELNSAIPGDQRDTSTPAAMADSMSTLLLTGVLREEHRQQLATWMKGNTTGGARIRAGVPTSWTVGDKTGSAPYGTASDIAVIWPVDRAPVILTVYTTRPREDAEKREDILAKATRVVVQWLA